MSKRQSSSLSKYQAVVKTIQESSELTHSATAFAKTDGAKTGLLRSDRKGAACTRRVGRPPTTSHTQSSFSTRQSQTGMNLSFVSDEDLPQFVSLCWGADLYNVLNRNPTGDYHISLTKRLSPQLEASNVTTIITNVQLLQVLYSDLEGLVDEMIGFFIFSVLFGLSLAASLLSLHYLLNNWKRTSSHAIVTCFTILISAFNMAIFGMKAATVVIVTRNLICPSPGPPFAFVPTDSSTFDLAYFLKTQSVTMDHTSLSLSVALVPIFVWVSDAFLIYRAWVIWVQRRKYIALPALVYFASIAVGVALLVQYLRANIAMRLNEISGQSTLIFSADRWLTALGFSCGLDALMTGMIAGRLIHHHRIQKRLTGSTGTTIYLPIVTIFIESAVLSLISKFLQLGIAYLDGTPIVVPLCTLSSNLIVLRKVLGADASEMLTNGKLDLSAPGLHRREVRSFTGSYPGFISHLIETIGGHVIDLGPFGIAETLVSPEEVAHVGERRS